MRSEAIRAQVMLTFRPNDAGGFDAWIERQLTQEGQMGRILAHELDDANAALPHDDQGKQQGEPAHDPRGRRLRQPERQQPKKADADHDDQRDARGRSRPQSQQDQQSQAAGWQKHRPGVAPGQETRLFAAQGPRYPRRDAQHGNRRWQ